MSKPFSKSVDKRSRDSMIAFLGKHYRYPTANSWNGSTSYANNVKVYNLGLSSEQENKLYSMLDIPKELYTPIFAIARMVGWSAHRIEELINMDKIMRPAYMSISKEREYKKLEQR